MNFHLDTLFYLHQVKSSDLAEELYIENTWKEAGNISKSTPKLTPSPEAKAEQQGDKIWAALVAILSWGSTPCRVGCRKQHIAIPTATFPRPTFQHRRWIDKDMAGRGWWKPECIFEVCCRHLQSLSFCSCQTCRVSVPAQRAAMAPHCFLSHFYGCSGFCPNIFFRAGVLSHNKTRLQPQGLSHQSCIFIVWIFTSILPFVLLNDKLSKYIPGLNSNVWVLQICLLQMLLIKYLPSHYPLGCIFLLALE